MLSLIIIRPRPVKEITNDSPSTKLNLPSNFLDFALKVAWRWAVEAARAWE